MPRFRHNNGMRSSVLQELGLSPLWRQKSAVAVARRHAVAVAPPSPPQDVTAPPPPRVTETETAPPPPPLPAPAAVARRHAASQIIINKMDWTPLKQTVEQCTLCGLSRARKNTAFGVGDRQAELMLIGEGPGAEEDKQGIPFVGEAGQLLDKMLFAIQRRREDNVYIANIVKCRPPDNRNPTAEEAHSCLPYLRQQIALVKPRLLVALGKIAATYLLHTTDSIAVLRQKIHDYEGIPLVVTYHPAYLLRSPKEKRKSWDDLRFIRRLLEEQK